MCSRHDLDWQKYIDDQAENREEFEKALDTCPSCLQEYLDLLLPSRLADPSPGFAERVMAALPSGPGRGYQAYKPVIHYLVAASLTLVFLELGAFDWVGTHSLQVAPGFLARLFGGLGDVIRGFITNLGGV